MTRTTKARPRSPKTRFRVSNLTVLVGSAAVTDLEWGTWPAFTVAANGLPETVRSGGGGGTAMTA
jgi:hypothetical protein